MRTVEECPCVVELCALTGHINIWDVLRGREEALGEYQSDIRVSRFFLCGCLIGKCPVNSIDSAAGRRLFPFLVLLIAALDEVTRSAEPDDMA